MSSCDCILGVYSAPVWTPQNRIFCVVADVDEKRQHLVMLDPTTTETGTFLNKSTTNKDKPESSTQQM
jgi:hypothetical protein